MVDRAKGIPAAAAAAAPTRSPSVCIMRVNPVGAMPKGSLTGLPSTFQPVSTVETSRRMAGLNCSPAKARLARAREISASAAPSA